MSKTNASDTGYVLGHSKEELERLEKQAAFFRESTRNMLICAGITKGMRVVDFGSGAGDVAILASELVGKTGEVIAVDRAPQALEWAKSRMATRGIENVATLVGDEYRLAEVFQANKVDAVVGRLVLMYQKDISALFCKLVECVRPGGIVAFQETDLAHAHWAEPALPLMSKALGWIAQTALALGVPTEMGTPIIRAFDQAGIQMRHIVLQGMIESGPDALSYDAYMEFMRGVLPAMRKLNISTPEELVELETLTDRLRDEAVVRRAVFIPMYLVSAYGRTPA